MLEKWALIILFAAAFGGACFVAGALYSEKEDAEDTVKVYVKKVEVIKYVAKEDNKASAKHEQEKEELRKEINGLRREYDGLRDVLDKRKGVCDLPPPVLSVLNRARGGSGLPADPSKPAGVVRPLAAPAEWGTGRSDKANDR